MSNLMQVLFQYLEQHRIQKYLASDPEYQEYADRSEKCLDELSALLDNAGGKLLNQYCDAACIEREAIDKAIFLATLELCRELHRTL